MLFIVVLCMVVYVQDAVFFIVAFLLSCAFLLFWFRQNINLFSTILVLTLAKLVELSLLPFLLQAGNFLLYPMWMLIDLLVVFGLMFKLPVLRMLYSAGNTSDYSITRADMLLGGIYVFYFILNLLALLEHSLRHLDTFGAPSDAGYVIYLYENLRIIYHLFPYLKHALNIMEFIAIWSTTVNYMQSNRVMLP